MPENRQRKIKYLKGLLTLLQHENDSPSPRYFLLNDHVHDHGLREILPRNDLRLPWQRLPHLQQEQNRTYKLSVMGLEMVPMLDSSAHISSPWE